MIPVASALVQTGMSDFWRISSSSPSSHTFHHLCLLEPHGATDEAMMSQRILG